MDISAKLKQEVFGIVPFIGKDEAMELVEMLINSPKMDEAAADEK